MRSRIRMTAIPVCLPSAWSIVLPASCGYANYAMVSNDDNANLNPWSQARTTGTPGSRQDRQGLSLGLRFDF
jgi:hypothetical protein